MKICILIPVYNHGEAIGIVLNGVLPSGIPVVLVDDGSNQECAEKLDFLTRENQKQVSLVRLPLNEGKGGAVMAGMRAAQEMGYSHVLQIDADGQHNTEDISKFLETSRRYPRALICGCPVYDESIPRGRLYGRYATHIWVWINTLSLEIKDSMCGFRVYPLTPVMELISSIKIGRHMDFDVEILVRLHWQGMSIVSIPTRVTYPLDGVSHFRLWEDNVRISQMHAKLFFGMLLRLPRLLARKIRGYSNLLSR